MEKFTNRYLTANKERRASVLLNNPKTLWINTGTLCNITCNNCYIFSSPRNDDLIYFQDKFFIKYLKEIKSLNWPIEEIGFTGGEPFLNKEILIMSERALKENYRVLILTNAMQPMQRSGVKKGLIQLHKMYGDNLKLRVSIDHYTMEKHDEVRGRGSFSKTIEGVKWLMQQGIKTSVAGRNIWNIEEEVSRKGYEKLFSDFNLKIDAFDKGETILFPEMNEQNIEVPEITTKCWSILGKDPSSIMCSNSRMVIHRKGEKKPKVVACTLLPYEKEFELGDNLKASENRVYLNHPHCAKFCVLGGASCS